MIEVWISGWIFKILYYEFPIQWKHFWNR